MFALLLVFMLWYMIVNGFPLEAPIRTIITIVFILILLLVVFQPHLAATLAH